MPWFNRQWSALLDAIAQSGFLVLFPGFVIYHYAVGASWIPPFAGGLFGAASALLVVFALAHLAGQLLKRPQVGLEWAFIAFGVYLFCWTCVAGIAIAGRPYAAGAVMESLATLSVWFAVYYCASRLRMRSEFLSRPLLASGLLILALLLHAVWRHQSLIGPFLAFQGEEIAGQVATTYQGIGRSILVLAIVLSCTRRGLWHQLIVLAVAIVALLAVGSRAHFVVAILLALILAAAGGLRRRNPIPALALLALLLVAGYAAAGLVLETRIGEIASLGESLSWQARLAAQREALSVISSSPFLGSFGYHLGRSSAGYSHNVLSAWAQFGGLAFLVYAGLIVYALAASARRVLFDANCTPLWLGAFQFSLAALVLAVASEPIFASVFPALGWAFVVSAVRDDRKRLAAVASIVEQAGPSVEGGATGLGMLVPETPEAS